MCTFDQRRHGGSDAADVYNAGTAFDDLGGVVDQLKWAYNPHGSHDMTWRTRLSSMSWPERCLLLQAMFLVSAIRVALALSSFGGVERGLNRLGRALTVTRRAWDADSSERVVRAVSRASAYVPGASCLTQALAVRLLLTRQGCRPRLCIGFGQRAGGGLEGHAWVESDGGVVVGGGDLTGYERLPGLAGENSIR